MKRVVFLIFLIVYIVSGYTQPYQVDGIIAIVGKEIILNRILKNIS